MNELDNAIKHATSEFIKALNGDTNMNIINFEVSRKLPSRINDKNEKTEISLTIKYMQK